MTDTVETPIEEPASLAATVTQEPEAEVGAHVDMSPEEASASSKGWTPDKDAYEEAHPGKKWKSAEAFLDAEEMIGSIMELKRELREQSKVARELVQHNQRLAEMGKAQKLAAIEARQLEAAEIGDVEAFKQAKAAYHQEMQAPIEPLAPAAQPPEETAAFKAFSEKHSAWCNKNTEENRRMVAAADQIYILMGQEFPGKTYEERLQMTEDKMKAVFSHKFVNTNRQMPQATTTPKSPAPTKAKHGWKYEDLNHTQKLVCDSLVKAGKTRDFYLEQLAGMYGPRT